MKTNLIILVVQRSFAWKLFKQSIQWHMDIFFLSKNKKFERWKRIFNVSNFSFIYSISRAFRFAFF